MPHMNVCAVTTSQSSPPLYSNTRVTHLHHNTEQVYPRSQSVGQGEGHSSCSSDTIKEMAPNTLGTTTTTMRANRCIGVRGCSINENHPFVGVGRIVNENHPSVTDSGTILSGPAREVGELCCGGEGAFPGSEEGPVSHRNTPPPRVVSTNRIEQQNLHDYQQRRSDGFPSPPLQTQPPPPPTRPRMETAGSDYGRCPTDTYSVKSESIYDPRSQREAPTGPEGVFPAYTEQSDTGNLISAPHPHCPSVATPHMSTNHPSYYNMYGDYGQFQGHHGADVSDVTFPLREGQGFIRHDGAKSEFPHQHAESNFGYERSKSTSPQRLNEFGVDQIKSESVFDSGSCDDSYFSDRSTIAGFPPIERRKRRGGRTMAAREEGISDEDWERIRRRRERNKMAAQRCREKKRFAAHHLVEENQRLESSNTSLKYEIKKLQQYKTELEDALSNHTCKMASHIPSNTQRACTPQAQAQGNGGHIVGETAGAPRACTPHAQCTLTCPIDPINRSGDNGSSETVSSSLRRAQDITEPSRMSLGTDDSFGTGYSRSCHSGAVNEGQQGSDFRGQPSVGTVGSFTSELVSADNTRRYPGVSMHNVFSNAYSHPCSSSRPTSSPINLQCSTQSHSRHSGERGDYNTGTQSDVNLPFTTSRIELLPASQTRGQDDYPLPVPMNMSQAPKAPCQMAQSTQQSGPMLNQPNLDDIQSLLSTQRNQYTQ